MMAAPEVPTTDHSPVATPASSGTTLLLVGVALVSSLGLARLLGDVGERFVGTVEAQQTHLASSRDAVIDAIHAAPGDLLEASSPLVVLRDDELADELASAERDVAALKAELDRVQSRADVELTWRMKEIQADIVAVRLHSATLLKDQYANRLEGVAWKEFADQIEPIAGVAAAGDVFESVVFRGSLSDESRLRAVLKREAANNSAEVNAAQLQICEQRLKELEKIRDELPASIRRAEGVEVAEARLAQATARVEQLQRRQRQLTLSGEPFTTVGVFTKRVGDRVAAGEPIVNLLDLDRRYLSVELPTRALPKFPPGTAVHLRFPGGEKRTGLVQQIPPQTTANAASGSSSPAALVRLQIDPTGQLWPEVPIGTAVEVSLSE